MATFNFDCPQCRQTIEADELLRGQVAECPHCGRNIVVPRIQSYIDIAVGSKKNGLWATIKKYYTHKGRIRRRDFLLAELLIFPICHILNLSCCAVGVLAAVLCWRAEFQVLAVFIGVPMGLIGLFLGLAIWIASWHLKIRRLHDLNLSGLWALPWFIGPWTGFIWFIVVASLDGICGNNKFGEDPKGRVGVCTDYKMVVTGLTALTAIEILLQTLFHLLFRLSGEL